MRARSSSLGAARSAADHDLEASAYRLAAACASASACQYAALRDSSVVAVFSSMTLETALVSIAARRTCGSAQRGFAFTASSSAGRVPFARRPRGLSGGKLL